MSKPLNDNNAYIVLDKTEKLYVRSLKILKYLKIFETSVLCRFGPQRSMTRTNTSSIKNKNIKNRIISFQIKTFHNHFK